MVAEEDTVLRRPVSIDGALSQIHTRDDDIGIVSDNPTASRGMNASAVIDATLADPVSSGR